MSFQSLVRFDLAFGVPGEVRLDGPMRVQPAQILSANAANNIVGSVFTRAAGISGIWRAGNPDGLGTETGILANPKVYAAVGTAAGGTLAPTLTLPNNTIGEMMTMGQITAVTQTAGDVGSEVIYDGTTGLISLLAAGTAIPSGSFQLGHAKVDRFQQPNAPGLMLLTLTEISSLPSEI